MSARTRAQLHLSVSTFMPVPLALEHVKIAAARVKGGGASLLTTGLQNAGAQVNIEAETADRLAMSITSGRRLIELCTFSACATIDPATGATVLHIGGLETYKTSQSTILGFIPAGPKMIAGYAPYKRFLDECRAELATADLAARATLIGV